MLWELTQRVVTLFSWLFSFVRWLHSYKKTYHLNCHVFCSRFMQFLESVGLLAIFSSFPRRASHLSMKHNLNVECEIPPMVRLYSNEKHDILNQKINPKLKKKKSFRTKYQFYAVQWHLWRWHCWGIISKQGEFVCTSKWYTKELPTLRSSVLWWPDFTLQM